MRITMVGVGYVGLTAGVCFAEMGHSVVCLDVDKNKIKNLQHGICPIYEEGLTGLINENLRAGRLVFTTDYSEACNNADAIFLAVATPGLPDGSADLAGLFQAAQQIERNMNRGGLVVIKSTVPPGTCDAVEKMMNEVGKIKAEVASNPEFLTQGSAVFTSLHADRVVIGTESAWAEAVLNEIYNPFELPIVSVSRRSAEMIKYACNSFLALKISYMNEIADLCEKTGAVIGDVALGLGMDKRIGDKFLHAGIGFGGSCLPKDTAALEHLAREAGCELKTVRAAMDVNASQKTILLKKAEKRFPSFEGMRFAILGLTFKPGTDDLRDAPSVENIALLMKMGADIIVYDPAGLENFKKTMAVDTVNSGKIVYAPNAQEALKGSDACFVFTEWDEFKVLTPGDFIALMKTPVVFDGRNLYNVMDMKKHGVEYYSIGRPNFDTD